MASQILTIQEAAKLSQKSTQTIRRLIKMNKIKCKRKRTPQGFNYELDKDSLMKYLGITVEEVKESKKAINEEAFFELNVAPDTARSKRQKKSVLEEIAIPYELTENIIDGEVTDEINEGISIETVENEEVQEKHSSSSKDALQFAAVLQQVLRQHQEDKDRLFALVEQFQKRTLILEERIKRLEAPKRPWWQLW